MELMNSIDLLEYLIAKFLSEDSRTAIFNYRLILNLLTRLLLYLAWIYLIHPNSYYNDDYAFSAALWLLFDVQIFLDWIYISGDHLLLFRRQTSYKIIDILSDIVIFFYIYKKELDSNMLIPMLVLLSLDFIINCFELGNHLCRKEELSNEDDRQDQEHEDGGRKLFFFSILVGSIYSFYTLIQANNYGDSLREEQITQYEASDEASQIEIPFVCGQITSFLNLVGLVTTNILILYLICKTETSLFSTWQDKTILLIIYGVIAGMMNFFMFLLMGLFAMCYIIYLMDKCFPTDNTQTVTVVTEGVTSTVEITQTKTVEAINYEPTVPGWYGD